MGTSAKHWVGAEQRRAGWGGGAQSKQVGVSTRAWDGRSPAAWIWARVGAALGAALCSAPPS